MPQLCAVGWAVLVSAIAEDCMAEIMCCDVRESDEIE